MKRSHEGFTTLELLVVLGVVVVLAGLMLPALSAAKERARLVNCFSNQRQLAAAFGSYASDWDGVLPRWWTPDGGPRNSTLGLQRGERDWAVDTLPYVQDERLYLCPGKKLVRGYGVNLWLATHEGFNVGDVEFPTRTLIFSEIRGKVPSDSVFDFTDRCTPEEWPVDPRFNFDPRHRGGANMAFMDGHVKWVASSKHTRWSPVFKQYLSLTSVSVAARGTPVGTYWWPSASSPPGN